MLRHGRAGLLSAALPALLRHGTHGHRRSHRSHWTSGDSRTGWRHRPHWPPGDSGPCWSHRPCRRCGCSWPHRPCRCCGCCGSHRPCRCCRCCGSHGTVCHCTTRDEMEKRRKQGYACLRRFGLFRFLGVLLDDPFDQLHRTLDAVGGGVDAQVVVDGIAPLVPGIELVVAAVLFV